MTSVRAGNVAVIEVLLAAGAQPNATGGARDQTALMWAVVRREHDVVRALIKHGADVHARSRVRREYVSFGRGDPQGGRLRGAADGTLESDGTRPGVGWINKGGMTALMLAAQQGDLESVKILVAAGARINESTPEPASSVLMLAAHNDHGDVAMFLLENGAEPNLTGAGYTALHLAAARKNTALVEALLNRGANPNVQLTKGTPRADDPAGRSILLPEYLVGATPLILASALNEVGIMRALVRHGADPHLAMKDGTTVLIAAMGINPGILGLPAFRKGSTRRTQDGYTKMAAAAEEGVLETVKLAVELGVDVNAQRVGGVVYHGANPRTQYGRDDGDTALHTATADKLQTVVEFLVSHGARLDIKDKRGLTPLAMAASDKNLIISGADDGGGKLGDPALAETLRRLGAEQ
jgi:cytohesin